MVQREVADRFFAVPSTKAYGAVSVLVQLATERTGLHPVSREVFRPRPNVESALVAFERTRPAAPTRASSGSSRPRSPTAARRSPTRSRSPASSREQARRGARRDRPRRRTSAPRRSRRPSSPRSRRRFADRAGPGEAQPRARRRPAPRRRQARARHRLPAPRPRATASASSRRTRTSRRTGSTATRSSGARSPRSARRTAGASSCGSSIPVAAGLGGGSSDAATALRLANAQLAQPLAPAELHALAARVGADVPFFLADGPQLGTRRRDRARAARPAAGLHRAALPAARRGEAVDRRRLRRVRRARRRRRLRRARRRAARSARRRSRGRATSRRCPPNDLASSPFAERLRTLGAFRADVSGAGPTVYGLFHHRADARRAERASAGLGRAWITVPAWYG